ncbi:MAG: imidazole glycerol phosphate synthase subunit HisH [Bacteroidota bacterium]|nr:imidazole glycerol phosphate synthase subunit HisH [Candidatus Kapabacteria bacterium]MDW8219083.1 imidazole glycerol phosphate synthase subunit HisH [Bacteroidota bacterium]
MTIAVVQYNAGNIQSLLFALQRLGIHPCISDDARVLRSADKVIFPGVGEARSAMTYLRERGLDTVITSLQQPVLGICIGMQLLCAYSEEQHTECMGVFDARVQRLVPVIEGQKRLKVPHIGWNIVQTRPHPLFAHLPSEFYAYYVHSYAVEPVPETIATTTYTRTFSSALHSNNFYAVQFHPEKSGEVGMQVLKNFLEL